ncbi:response regulator transcription factor [Streptomyces sp. NBC_01478]|uniref:helix-turn-helix transcriptional regulator n=1 Tax=Streptomyces sp. NBC_01478 TaxID=2903882 RepID=UPI002E2FCA4C|nr:response regulator transcription factor [Streptomyces sp. NBC_01478]
MPQRVLGDSLRVAIHAPAPLIRAGLAGFVAMEPRLREVPPDRIRDADAIVVAVDVADASVLDLLPRLSDDPRARFLVVVSKRWQADVPTARHRGVRAVVWWDFCSPDVFVRTVRAVAGEDGTKPSARRQQTVDRAALSSREVAVLRLIAEGRQCEEIATELAYSERTVRYILYGAMKRLRARNRAHAVSYAIRAGLI